MRGWSRPSPPSAGLNENQFRRLRPGETRLQQLELLFLVYLSIDYGVVVQGVRPFRLHALQLTNRPIHGALDRASNTNQADRRSFRTCKHLAHNRLVSLQFGLSAFSISLGGGMCFFVPDERKWVVRKRLIYLSSRPFFGLPAFL